eukprot:366077-Prorocentrum_minimum.AAC.2
MHSTPQMVRNRIAMYTIAVVAILRGSHDSERSPARTCVTATAYTAPSSSRRRARVPAGGDGYPWRLLGRGSPAASPAASLPPTTAAAAAASPSAVATRSTNSAKGSPARRTPSPAPRYPPPAAAPSPPESALPNQPPRISPPESALPNQPPRISLGLRNFRRRRIGTQRSEALI